MDLRLRIAINIKISTSCYASARTSPLLSLTESSAKFSLNAKGSLASQIKWEGEVTSWEGLKEDEMLVYILIKHQECCC